MAFVRKAFERENASKMAFEHRCADVPKLEPFAFCPNNQIVGPIVRK